MLACVGATHLLPVEALAAAPSLACCKRTLLQARRPAKARSIRPLACCHASAACICAAAALSSEGDGRALFHPLACAHPAPALQVVAAAAAAAEARAQLAANPIYQAEQASLAADGELPEHLQDLRRKAALLHEAADIRKRMRASQLTRYVHALHCITVLIRKRVRASQLTRCMPALHYCCTFTCLQQR